MRTKLLAKLDINFQFCNLFYEIQSTFLLKKLQKSTSQGKKSSILPYKFVTLPKLFRKKGMKSRIEVEAGINGCLLISDNFSSDITSLTKHAISFLELQLANKDRHRVLIVSDIDGDEIVCEMFYRNLSQFLRSGSVNQVVFIGIELRQRFAKFEGLDRKDFFLSADEFLSSDVISQFANQALLLKISQHYQPIKIKNHLQQLPHDTSLEIDFDAMYNNVQYFRSKLRPETKLMCMVKASAYGSGSLEVSLAMQHYGCDYLGVAFVNEGVELRQSGIKMPIIVLNPMQSSLHHLFEYNLEPEIGNFRILNMVLAMARKLGLTDYPIHIKLDTGMHRAGFEADDLERLTKILTEHRELRVASIFSHLAAADDPAEDMHEFTLGQIALFEKLSQKIIEKIGYKPIRHILNSAGIEHYSDYQMDMVRLGIGIWGVPSKNSFQLRNVCSLYTRIIQIKNVKAGETVGYNRKGQIEKDKHIALLPIGYADGMNRRLSNGLGYVLINGKRAYIVGNICMDLMMVDVTDIEAKAGDTVVVFSSEHTFEEIAESIGTIPYEVLSSISPRVRRVYFSEEV